MQVLPPSTTDVVMPSPTPTPLITEFVSNTEATTTEATTTEATTTDATTTEATTTEATTTEATTTTDATTTEATTTEATTTEGITTYFNHDNIITGSEAVFSAKLFVFEAPFDERCATISVADNNITESSRLYRLILRDDGVHNVPVRLHPKTLPIIVIDNDDQGKSTVAVLLAYNIVLTNLFIIMYFIVTKISLHFDLVIFKREDLATL